MWIEALLLVILIAIVAGSKSVFDIVNDGNSILSEIQEAHEEDSKTLKSIEQTLDSIDRSLGSLDSVSDLLVAVNEAALLQLPKVPDDAKIRQMILEYLEGQPTQQANYSSFHEDLAQRIHTEHQLALERLGVRGPRKAIIGVLFSMRRAGELSFDTELVSLSRQAKE